MSTIKLLPALILLISLGGCRKKDLPATVNPPVINPVTTGSVHIKIENFVGNRPLTLNSLAPYNAPNGEQFSIHTYRYYLSNFVLTDESGNRFAEKDSYHLIMADSANSLEFNIKDIPAAQYTTIEFMIGIDSLHNVTGAQSGHLAPEYGMLWSWSTGYIMAKMEGSLIIPDKDISYHIAGFKGEYNVNQQIKLSFPEKAIISDIKMPAIILKSDLNTWFNPVNFAGFSSSPVITSAGKPAYQISQNYKSMMSVSKVENQ